MPNINITQRGVPQLKFGHGIGKWQVLVKKAFWGKVDGSMPSEPPRLTRFKYGSGYGTAHGKHMHSFWYLIAFFCSYNKNLSLSFSFRNRLSIPHIHRSEQNTQNAETRETESNNTKVSIKSWFREKCLHMHNPAQWSWRFQKCKPS